MLENANINIADSSGNLRDIDEIIRELELELEGHSTHSMNEHALFLHGERSALVDTIAYLKRVA